MILRGGKNEKDFSFPVDIIGAVADSVSVDNGYVLRYYRLSDEGNGKCVYFFVAAD